jgi:simple sugar transport system permease protein
MAVTKKDSTPMRGTAFTKIGRFKFQFVALGIFLAIWIIFVIINPLAFLNPSIYVAILALTAIMAILAISETSVVVCGEFDLSFPSAMALSAMVFTYIFLSTGNSVIAALGAVCAGTAVGVLNGILVAKMGLPSLITTIGAMFFWEGMVAGITMGQIVIPGLLETNIHNILVSRVWGFIPAQTFWAIGIMILFWVMMNRHKIGAHIYCVGDNVESSTMMGVNVAWTKFFVFVQMGFIAGFAGLMTLLELGVFFPDIGSDFFLPVIAAVFLGGTSPLGGEGSVFGSLMGALILGLLWVGISGIISGLWRDMFYGLILTISLVVQAFMRRGAR